jgi:hypothetical protein
MRTVKVPIHNGCVLPQDRFLALWVRENRENMLAPTGLHVEVSL